MGLAGALMVAVSTVAASLITLTALLGYSGIMLNNRTFLAIYTFLLWPCLAFMVAPGYISYKQKTFNLEGKINLQWSRNLGTEGRLRIQNAVSECSWCQRRCLTPGPAPMLWILFTIRRSYSIASVLLSIHSTWVQASIPAFGAICPHHMVHHIIFPCSRPAPHHCRCIVVLQPYHLPVWQGFDTKALQAGPGQYGLDHGQLCDVRLPL